MMTKTSNELLFEQFQNVTNDAVNSFKFAINDESVSKPKHLIDPDVARMLLNQISSVDDVENLNDFEADYLMDDEFSADDFLIFKISSALIQAVKNLALKDNYKYVVTDNDNNYYVAVAADDFRLDNMQRIINFNLFGGKYLDTDQLDTNNYLSYILTCLR